ncbi:TPA: hypothetical protein O4F88_004781, partial [Vibrio alginolyticus]|nr:hypothetical protein [Vibrio alginolyticus]
YNETEKRTENSTLLDGVICGMIDISDRVTLNEKLIEAKDQANAASQAKSQFLATMSHEIRTPINAIVGLLDLFLRKSENLEFDIKSIELANDSAHDLLILIGDILDLAKIESGKLTIHSKKNQIAKCIESIYNVYSYVARQKNINFNVELDRKIDSYLMF